MTNAFEIPENNAVDLAANNILNCILSPDNLDRIAANDGRAIVSGIGQEDIEDVLGNPPNIADAIALVLRCIRELPNRIPEGFEHGHSGKNWQSLARMVTQDLITRLAGTGKKLVEISRGGTVLNEITGSHHKLEETSRSITGGRDATNRIRESVLDAINEQATKAITATNVNQVISPGEQLEPSPSARTLNHWIKLQLEKKFIS